MRLRILNEVPLVRGLIIGLFAALVVLTALSFFAPNGIDQEILSYTPLWLGIPLAATLLFTNSILRSGATKIWVYLGVPLALLLAIAYPISALMVPDSARDPNTWHLVALFSILYALVPLLLLAVLWLLSRIQLKLRHGRGVQDGI